MRVIRDFKCRECGLVFDRYSDKNNGENCPRCNGVDTKSILSAAAIKVTGQGAYTNKMKVK